MSFERVVGSIIEVGYMVRDIDAAMDRWMRLLGAGPFFRGEIYIPPERHECRGEPGPLSMKVAFGLSGDILIELVEPLPDDTSFYSEALAEIGAANHSCAINYVVNMGWDEGNALLSDEYEAVLTATTNMDGLRCTIFDTRKDIGATIEIGEGINQMLLPMIEELKRRREHWDGVSIYSLADVFNVSESAIAA